MCDRQPFVMIHHGGLLILWGLRKIRYDENALQGLWKGKI